MTSRAQANLAQAAVPNLWRFACPLLIWLQMAIKKEVLFLLLDPQKGTLDPSSSFRPEAPRRPLPDGIQGLPYGPRLKRRQTHILPSFQQSWKCTKGFPKRKIVFQSSPVNFHDCWREGKFWESITRPCSLHLTQLASASLVASLPSSSGKGRTFSCHVEKVWLHSAANI